MRFRGPFLPVRDRPRVRCRADIATAGKWVPRLYRGELIRKLRRTGKRDLAGTQRAAVRSPVPAKDAACAQSQPIQALANSSPPEASANCPAVTRSSSRAGGSGTAVCNLTVAATARRFDAATQALAAGWHKNLTPVLCCATAPPSTSMRTFGSPRCRRWPLVGARTLAPGAFSPSASPSFPWQQDTSLIHPGHAVKIVKSSG
jgi:hypothetical protein